MRRITISNFGPVKTATIDLEKKLQVFVGAQASGKSTVCKAIYFCRKIRDYTLDFLMDSDQFLNNNKNEYFNNYLKFLTKQFMGCFGKTTHMNSFLIKYEFGAKYITIKLNQDGYIRFIFDKDLKNSLRDLIDESSKLLIDISDKSKISSIMDTITAHALLKNQFTLRLNDLFEDEDDIIYIPAGRSLLATLSEQLHDFSVSDMDLTMQDFINLIRNTKTKFGYKIPEIVKNYTKTVKGQVDNKSLDLAYNLIKEILKADYASENDGEKIYFDDSHWVKLMYGSSGQQEVLWILMIAFIIILEKRRSFVIIEEPEAHLFPIAQKNVTELIALMVNVTNSSAIITTHSPYILTSMNILLYSYKVENSPKSKGKSIIDKNMRIPYNSFAAYAMRNKVEDIMDEEMHMIKTDYIDEVSSITNEELNKLLDKELGE